MKIKDTYPVIRIIGSIDEEAFAVFCEQISILEKAKAKTVILELSSGGGNAYDALAFVSKMRLSKVNFIIKAYGLIASAATIILAAGNYRQLAKESWVMVHEDTAKMKGNISALENEIKHCRNMEDQWNGLLEKMTRTEWQKWEELNKRTTYLTADECLKLGLVDEVI